MNSKLAIVICAFIWLLALWAGQAMVPIYQEIHGPRAPFVHTASWRAVPMAMLGLLTLAVIYFRGGRYPKRSALTAIAFWLLGVIYLLTNMLPALLPMRCFQPNPTRYEPSVPAPRVP